MLHMLRGFGKPGANLTAMHFGPGCVGHEDLAYAKAPSKNAVPQSIYIYIHTHYTLFLGPFGIQGLSKGFSSFARSTQPFHQLHIVEYPYREPFKA